MPEAPGAGYEGLRAADTAEVRLRIRRGDYSGHTAGLAAGKLQTNVVILPAEQASHFADFCRRNPKPCPLVGQSEAGVPLLSTLGSDLDIRTDLPAYNLYRDGILDESRSEILDLWSDDLVAFALGCSFTFERALTAAGISLWHIVNNKTVPMYRTGIATDPAGPFGGEMVVSMRNLHPDQIDEAVRISDRYPWAHGGPVHIGDPKAIGIDDLGKPDWGDPPPPPGEDVPVFWACGVTPQSAIMRAKLPFCITHKPGCMLITDVDEFTEPPIIRQT